MPKWVGLGCKAKIPQQTPLEAMKRTAARAPRATARLEEEIGEPIAKGSLDALEKVKAKKWFRMLMKIPGRFYVAALKGKADVAKVMGECLKVSQDPKMTRFES